MLNKCTDKAWFVVELCESIKAFKVELANFELFSSSPKDIRISMSNVFPGRDKDWILYGQFEANEDRTVQSFISNEGVFGKFVKVPFHILRKHLHRTKLNSITYFFKKNSVFFCKNKRILYQRLKK